MFSQEKQRFLLQVIPLEGGVLLVLKIINKELTSNRIIFQGIKVLQQLLQCHYEEILFLFFVLEQAFVLSD